MTLLVINKMLSKRNFIFNIQSLCKSCYRQLYVQGQSPSPNIREYFYYIDHQGMVCIVPTLLKKLVNKVIQIIR